MGEVLKFLLIKSTLSSRLQEMKSKLTGLHYMLDFSRERLPRLSQPLEVVVVGAVGKKGLLQLVVMHLLRRRKRKRKRKRKKSTWEVEWICSVTVAEETITRLTLVYFV